MVVKSNHARLRELLIKTYELTSMPEANFDANLNAMGPVRLAEVIAMDLWLRGIHKRHNEYTIELSIQLDNVHTHGIWDYEGLKGL